MFVESWFEKETLSYSSTSVLFLDACSLISIWGLGDRKEYSEEWFEYLKSDVIQRIGLAHHRKDILATTILGNIHSVFQNTLPTFLDRFSISFKLCPVNHDSLRE